MLTQTDRQTDTIPLHRPCCKPAAVSLLLWVHAHTDRWTEWTDTVLLHRPCSAYYAGSTKKVIHDVKLLDKSNLDGIFYIIYACEKRDEA